jgi:hypothetical protein
MTEHRPSRRAPKSLTVARAVLYSVLALVGGFLLLGIIGLAAGVDTEPAKRAPSPEQQMPACELEDGSTQPICRWDDGSGHPVVNIDYGSVSYNPETNTFTYYKDRDAR